MAIQEVRELNKPVSTLQIPQHVAIIMDGNGRWAQRRGQPRLFGHQAGTDNLTRVVEMFADYGVKYLTLYAFSTENWKRPIDEVMGLLGLLERVIRRETANLKKKGVRLRHLGRLEGISPALQNAIARAIDETKDNTRITLSIAFNYGGRAEILDAVRRLVAEGVDISQMDEELFSRYLYSDGIPDPDLVIRTGGEMRVSNFLIWQAAYAEYYATPVFWPDFGACEIREALETFTRRERRFGGLSPTGG
ncbi:MAG: di-trans,poly-cis-decaprenylcistransferase [Chloroflexota bacterium]|nr:MAG: di-trans,poly-cis-decaprenylcistransferase [Chloroflexota bacterium]